MKTEEYAEIAKKWFKDNNVEIPTGSVSWQKKSVRNKEIPPGMSYVTLHKKKINIQELLSFITEDFNKFKKHNHAPITESNIEHLVGLQWLNHTIVNKHKKVVTKCLNCNRIEKLDYGTIQRMKKANNKFCRYCRNAGGKSKDLERYNRFNEFTPIKIDSKRITFICSNCNNEISRSLGYATTAEYLVCEHCNPSIMSSTLVDSEFGTFHSKIELESYKILLKYLDSSDIELQKPYNVLFKTNTSHTADFYIAKLDLVLEVTTKTNNFPKYIETTKWKESISNKVKFAYSLKEVEDIVRSLLKNSE